LPRRLEASTARVWFDTEETPYFFWLIPESDGTAVVGLIGENGTAVRDSLDRFLDKQGLSPSAYQGGRIPRYDSWISPHRKLGGGDVYLVGDAAGQAKVTTVGGIVTGFKGAMAAAEAIASGNGHASFRALRRELDLHLRVRQALRGFDQAGYRALIAHLSRSSAQTLGKYTRDEMPKLLPKLLLRQPRLLVLGLRSILFNRASSGR
jgi:flavin-dependent dehydrogenase